MSKKSPKNKSPQEEVPETPSEEVLVESQESVTDLEIEETLPGENESLTEIIAGELLGAEVPAGETPPLSHVLEAILFASQKAVSPKELLTHLKSAAAAEPTSVAAAFARIKEGDVLDALTDLQAEVAASGLPGACYGDRVAPLKRSGFCPLAACTLS